VKDNTDCCRWNDLLPSFLFLLQTIFSEELPPLSKDQVAAMEIIKNVRTTPRDPRFSSSQNQAAHCWNRYNEWLLCLKNTKGDEEGCKNMRQFAVSICPTIWTEKWDEERDEGKFAGIQV
jgi:cytochrome c oxidase subunit 6b